MTSWLAARCPRGDVAVRAALHAMHVAQHLINFTRDTGNADEETPMVKRLARLLLLDKNEGRERRRLVMHGFWI